MGSYIWGGTKSKAALSSKFLRTIPLSWIVWGLQVHQRANPRRRSKLAVFRKKQLNLNLIIKEEMKNPSWIRKNWLLVAGVTFVGVHLGTYLIQRAAKESVRSQSRDKQRNIEE